MSDAILLRGLTKTFGSTVAVDNLDLAVPRGALYGLIGPNGAGKTTTIRMIMSILFPDEGEVKVLGHASALEAKDRIGYLPEERGVYKKMKVGAFLRFMGVLKGVDGPDKSGRSLDQRVEAWLKKVELPHVAGKRCEELSKGMQQKIQFIAAVIHEPDLLILDEPFSGLDPVNMRLLRDLIFEQHQRGATLIFSTHVMHQAEQLCDHIVMIHGGKKVLDDTLSDIRARSQARTLLFEPLDPAAPVDVLESLAAVESVRRNGGCYEVLLHEGVAPAPAMQEIVSRVPPLRIELHRPTLEDVFIDIVTSSRHLPQAATSELRASLREDGARSLEEVS